MVSKLVEELSKRPCITVSNNTTIKELEEVLKKYNIGAVVISDKKENPLGIVSERDIVRNLSKISSNLTKTLVTEIMSSNLITCSLKSTSEEIMKLMSTNKIRHIPIVENNKILGLVSIGDVVNRLLSKYSDETKLLREYINS